MKLFFTPARLAVLASCCATFSASWAQDVRTAALGEVVVTAARIPQDPSLLPQGVQVITASQIREFGALNVREAIGWLGGVVSRSDTASGREPVLDLRGFGETAASNVVILVDGVRQNEGDMNGTVLSWLPIDSIERIELVRGSGAILHGEGATGGIINIITSRGMTEPGGSAGLSLGSFQTRDARASVRTGDGPWRLELHGNAFDSDNHRQYFSTQERNAMARLSWSEGASQWSLQLGGQSSQGHQPGGVTPAEFAADPRRSFKALDTAKNELSNVLLSGERQIGLWRLAGDLNHRQSRALSDQASVPDEYVYRAETETASVRGGLRAWRGFEHGAQRHRLLIGVDAEKWDQAVQSDGYFVFDGMRFATPGRTDISQESRAVYARHEVQFRPQSLSLFAGVRRTWSERQAQGSSGGGLVDQRNSSWELGAAQQVGLSSEVFARLGTSFRLPNANEYTCFDPTQCTPSVVNLLRPQTSRDLELGYRHAWQGGRWSLSYYRHDLNNEIGYDRGNNRNFDPTRRQGVEAEVSMRLARAWEVGAQYAWRQATFRSGIYDGNDVPLVPSRSLTARAGWRMSPTQTWVLSTQLLSSQRIGDDFANASAERIAGYGIVNLRYSQKIDAHWTVSALASNLGDKAYYNYRTRVSPTARSVYPEAGRAFFVSAQRRF